MVMIKGESVRVDIVKFLKGTGQVPKKVLVHKLEPFYSEPLVEDGIKDLKQQHFIEIDAQDNVSISSRSDALGKQKTREMRESMRPHLNIEPKI
jgi:hypothetical protein|tara:strand:+ start:786 stop:1067 length:282 start_codon:yes stop_codon:yes gene_type:complete